MGAARRVLDDHAIPAEEKRNRTREQLEKDVQRALARLKTDRTDGPRNQAYVKALIRLNAFLLEERALLVSARN
jgi:hypothetical protein